MTPISKHIAMKKLVELGVVIPGTFNGTVGNMTYSPISIKDFIERIENEDVADLAYNTRAMGRSVFTFGENGEVINYKGVDSKLKNEASIANASTECTIETINEQDLYGINIVNFIYRNSSHTSGISRLEFRVKGASQFQNLLAEKVKNDDIRERDKRGLIKLPSIDYPTPLSAEMCESLDLPRVVDVEEDFLSSIDSKSYAGYCLAQMRQNGLPFNKRNELWAEYFANHHRERLDDRQLMEAAEREDSTYGLGAIFGQTPRVLENPFRINIRFYYSRKY